MIENLWPIPFYQKQHTDSVLLETVRDTFVSLKETRFNLSQLENIATQNGTQPMINNSNIFLENVSWGKQVLEQVISEAIFEVWREIQHKSYFVPNYWKVRAWFVGYDNGGFQSGHLHPYATVSGVWFIENTNTEEGILELFNPMLISHSQTRYNISHKVFPTKNLSVAFPSFLHHCAYPVTGEKISLAWDATAISEPEENEVCFRHCF